MYDTVAFIGLGAIGLPMAQSISRAGFAVIGVDPASEGRDRAGAADVESVATVAEARSTSMFVVMVATPSQLESVVDSAVQAGAVAGRVWILMSTVGPDAVTRAAAVLEAAGGRVVDAPVSGGIPRALRGELTLFVSGAPADVEAARDVLAAMGAVNVVGGSVGEGQSVKIVNQHLCAVHIVAAAEALALAERLGLDAGFVLGIIGQGAAESFMLGDRGPRMLAGGGAPVLSQIGIFVKDTGLVADAGIAASIDLPLLAAARQRFSAAAAAGLVAHDDSSVIEVYRAEGAEQ